MSGGLRSKSSRVEIAEALALGFDIEYGSKHIKVKTQAGRVVAILSGTAREKGRGRANALATIRRAARAEAGQVIVIATLLMGSLLGVAGLVIDVGSWYQIDRSRQGCADAGALDGSRALAAGWAAPDAATAVSNALAANGCGSDPRTLGFPGGSSISVAVEALAPAFFLKALGYAGPTVHAEAQAEGYAVTTQNPCPAGKRCPPFVPGSTTVYRARLSR